MTEFQYATRYRIVPSNPQAHLFTITCSVSAPDPEGQMFSLPAWIPGSYMVRDFARNVVRLSAAAGGFAITVEKVDKQTWRCAPCEGELTITYEVYAWDLSVRSAHLDATHAYFNGSSVFLSPLGKESEPFLVELERPAGEAYADWRVATAMSRADAPVYGFGRYTACSYEELIDHPVEMGDFTVVTFIAGGISHDIAITGRHWADLDRLGRDLKRICEYQQGLFGALPPMERYVFLVTAVGDGYGGLEHRSSCSLLCSRDDLPRAGDTTISENYRGFLGLCSHEYFHTWNVKRIKPAAFAPYDLTREVYTRLLWAFEGITSYYDELALIRAGIITSESYLELLGQTITRVTRTPGRFKQSVSDSSFDAWIKFYKQDENSPNAIVSYYTKGALIALALDLTIRLRSEERFSLDTVMRELWRRFGQHGVGIREDEFERVVEEVTSLDLHEFFDTALRGTNDLALETLLGAFGVRYHLRGAESAKDKGGKPAANCESKPPLPVIGVKLAANGDSALINTVFEGSPAQESGLSAGDAIVAVDGIRVNSGTLEQRLRTYVVGASIRVHAFRRDELMEFQVTLREAPKDTCFLTLDPSASEAVRSRRSAWMGPST